MSFVVALQDIPEIWEISYDDKAAPIYLGLVHDYALGDGIAIPGKLNPRRGLDSSFAVMRIPAMPGSIR